MNPVNNMYRDLLLNLANDTRYNAEVSPRGQKVREMLFPFTSLIDMNYPLVDIPERKLSNKFAFAEAFWILSGAEDVEYISKYNKRIADFSDNGETFFGAYGPRISSQLNTVIDSLRADQDTRQAVMTIWRMNPPATKDVPCTVAVQWTIRKDANGDLRLHCHDMMRSSDAFWGWPYDVFNFSMLSECIRLELAADPKYADLKLGTLSLTATSQHLYERHFEAAKPVVNSEYPGHLRLANETKTAEELIKLLGEMADDALTGKPFEEYSKKLFKLELPTQVVDAEVVDEG